MRSLVAIAFGIAFVAGAGQAFITLTYPDCEAPMDKLLACFHNQEALMSLANEYMPGAMDDDDDMTTIVSDDSIERVRHQIQSLPY